VAPASVWQAGVGVEATPLLGLALSADLFGRHADDLVEPRPGFARAGDAISPDTISVAYERAEGRAFGLEMAARAEGGPWVLGATYTLSQSLIRSADEAGSAEAWRRARHDRPHVVGLIVQHDARHWHAAARLDVMSTAPGGVDGIFRLDLGAGYRFSAAGADWTVEVHAQPTAARAGPVANGVPPASITPQPLAFDADGATLPAWPTISVRATW
jgi:hypothetical protein